MKDFYQKLENLIFLQNYTSPLLSKEAALMCIHSALLRREHVPRVYLPDVVSGDKQTWIWNTISSCLLSNHKAVHDWTAASLKLLHISLRELQQLSSDNSLECLHLIEEALEDSLGRGYVYYEMSRFTPFTEQDITHILMDADAPSAIWQATLYRRLRERSFSKIQYHQKHINVIHKLNLRGDWDMFHTVCKFKLEQVWQQSWLDASNYEVDPSIINTIVVGDSFE